MDLPARWYRWKGSERLWVHNSGNRRWWSREHDNFRHDDHGRWHWRVRGCCLNGAIINNESTHFIFIDVFNNNNIAIVFEMIEENLSAMFSKADAIDVAEGKLAYSRYHLLMKEIAAKYDTPLDRVIAAFCSLSPNSDYIGNLRSLISVLEGLALGIEPERIIVSTYNHCKLRAIEYLRGSRCFVNETKGPKIMNFYHNISHPEDTRWVTIDGHIVAAARGIKATMKDALIGVRDYRDISSVIKRLAFKEFLLPNQYQAILWFTRKRILNVKYSPQISLLHGKDDAWQTSQFLIDLQPYPFRR